MKRIAVLVALLALVAACGDDDDDAAPATTEAPATTTTTAAPDPDDVYADPSSWLCRPDVEDVCEDDLDATVIEADGATEVEPFAVADDPPIDCFYVYPTVSMDPEDNSDMVAGAEEINVVKQQAARLGSVCALYAPMYRQATLTALRGSLGGGGGGFFAAYTQAYDDVLAAWQHYLADDNDGRGVIIIGHSQGASHLGKLLREVIDPDPAQRELLVSAILLGTSAHASETPNVPPCATAEDIGCLISWSTFRDSKPPAAGAFFARPAGAEPAVCTNPAALLGRGRDLHPYFSDGTWGVDVTTEFVTLPGLVSGECVERDGFHYLEVTVHADPGPRVDDIRGDLTPEWGLHLIDVNVAMGDLVEVARAQGAAYAGTE